MLSGFIRDALYRDAHANPGVAAPGGCLTGRGNEAFALFLLTVSPCKKTAGSWTGGRVGEF